MPTITFKDFFKILPVGMCSAGAHAASVFALGGDPLFAQIVKSGEPVFSARKAAHRGDSTSRILSRVETVCVEASEVRRARWGKLRVESRWSHSVGIEAHLETTPIIVCGPQALVSTLVYGKPPTALDPRLVDSRERNLR